MKRLITLALVALMTTGAFAEEKKDSVNKNKPVFTTIKENKITSIKDQNRSGTCWDYSTLSYFEAEILKKTGKTYDLCESFVANKTYMDRAIQVVRLHGDCSLHRAVALTTHCTASSNMVSAQRMLCLFLVACMATLLTTSTNSSASWSLT